MGDRYGPLVVSKNPFKPDDLKGKVIAIPGKMTSAFLILKLLNLILIRLLFLLIKSFRQSLTVGLMED